MANTHTGSHRIHTGFHKIQKSCGFSRNLYRIPQDSTGSRESCGTKMTEYQRLPNSKEVSLSTRYLQDSTRFTKIPQDRNICERWLERWPYIFDETFFLQAEKLFSKQKLKYLNKVYFYLYTLLEAVFYWKVLKFFSSFYCRLLSSQHNIKKKAYRRCQFKLSTVVAKQEACAHTMKVWYSLHHANNPALFHAWSHDMYRLLANQIAGTILSYFPICLCPVSIGT